MFKLENGLDHFWQWDTGQSVAVTDDCSYIDFSPEGISDSIRVKTKPYETMQRAEIPDSMLIRVGYLKLSCIVLDENGENTIARYRIRVDKKTKPECYGDPSDSGSEFNRLLMEIADLKNRFDNFVAESTIWYATIKDPVEDGVKTTVKTKQGDFRKTAGSQISILFDGGAAGEFLNLEIDGVPLEAYAKYHCTDNGVAEKVPFAEGAIAKGTIVTFTSDGENLFASAFAPGNVSSSGLVRLAESLEHPKSDPGTAPGMQLFRTLSEDAKNKVSYAETQSLSDLQQKTARDNIGVRGAGEQVKQFFFAKVEGTENEYQLTNGTASDIYSAIDNLYTVLLIERDFWQVFQYSAFHYNTRTIDFVSFNKSRYFFTARVTSPDRVELQTVDLQPIADAVRFTEQNLTEEQQATARANIGASAGAETFSVKTTAGGYQLQGKTYADILKAIEEKDEVYLSSNYTLYRYTEKKANAVKFAAVTSDEIQIFTVYDNSSVGRVSYPINKFLRYDVAQSLTAEEMERVRTAIGAARNLDYVQSVNGQTPGPGGNVQIEIPEDTVQTVNGKTPDSIGNISIVGRDVPGVPMISVRGDRLIIDNLVEVAETLDALQSKIGGTAP